jgi:hypothetical protein
MTVIAGYRGIEPLIYIVAGFVGFVAVVALVEWK